MLYRRNNSRKTDRYAERVRVRVERRKKKFQFFKRREEEKKKKKKKKDYSIERDLSRRVGRLIRDIALEHETVGNTRFTFDARRRLRRRVTCLHQR